MSTSIFIRGPEHSGRCVKVGGGTLSVAPLVDGVGRALKQSDPEIYETAFQALFGGDVYFDLLNPFQFRRVYELTIEEYEKYASRPPREDRKAMDDNWKEYLEALERDPRLSWYG